MLASNMQDADPRFVRLLFHRKQPRELQPRLVAKRSDKWMANNVLIVELRMDPYGIAVHQKGAKLVFRTIRCIQVEAAGRAAQQCAMDSALTDLLAEYNSDSDNESVASKCTSDGAADAEHNVAAELGVDVKHPSIGDGVASDNDAADEDFDGDNDKAYRDSELIYVLTGSTHQSWTMLCHTLSESHAKGS